MKVNILEMLLGQVPEAIYFALFMIFTKRLKEKRVLFTILMVIEYLLLIRTMPFNLYSHIGYFIITYIILKMLYKEKCQIIDIFTLAIASILLIILDLILYFTIGKLTNNYTLFAVIDKIILLGFVCLIKNKLPKLQAIYKKLWNRNDREKKKIKSTTFRSLNIVIFNITFYIINLGMLYCLYQNSLM